MLVCIRARALGLHGFQPAQPVMYTVRCKLAAGVYETTGRYRSSCVFVNVEICTWFMIIGQHMHLPAFSWSFANRLSAPALPRGRSRSNKTADTSSATVQWLSQQDHLPHLLGGLLQRARGLDVGCAGCWQPCRRLYTIAISFSNRTRPSQWSSLSHPG